MCWRLNTDSLGAVHGDDVITDGSPEDLEDVDKEMSGPVAKNVLPRIVPQKSIKDENMHLKIGRSEKGFTWEAGPRHAERIVKEMQSHQKAKDVASLASQGSLGKKYEELVNAGDQRWYQGLIDIARFIVEQERNTIYSALAGNALADRYSDDEDPFGQCGGGKWRLHTEAKERVRLA